MKKLSLKWKLFLIFSYIQLVFYGLFFCLAVMFIFSGKMTGYELVGMSIFGTIFLLSVLVNLLNIYLINKYFPDKLLSSRSGNLLKAARVINIIAILCLALIYFSAIIGDLDGQSGNKDNLILLPFYSIGITVWIFSVFALILQFQMNRDLRKNNNQHINSLIDSIGT